MIVSIVTPAFDASATLDRTLRSVASQTVADWEHIIVFDGPDPDGDAIASSAAARDDRIRLVRIAHGGPSVARNAGIEAATGEWLLFLDSDDTIDPHFIEKMTRRAHGDAADIVCCGVRRLNGKGLEIARFSPRIDPATPLDAMRECPPGAIHSLMVKRQVIETIGGFDPALRTNEDWDLWRRVAQAGVRFAVEPEILADYWSTPGSLTRNAARMIEDASTMRRRLGPDDAADTAQQLSTILWNGAIDVGAGGNGMDIAKLAEPLPSLPDDRAPLADALLEGLAIGCETPVANLFDRWDSFADRIGGFIDAAAGSATQPELAFGVRRDLERALVRTGQLRRASLVGASYAVPLTPLVLAAGIDVPGNADTLLIKLPLLRPRGFFLLSIPAQAGRMSGSQLLRIAVRQTSQRLIDRSAETSRARPVLDRLVQTTALTHRALRKGLALMRLRAPDLPPAQGAPDAVAERTPGGKAAEAWDTFFGHEDPWNYGNAYEQLKYQRTLDLIGHLPAANALELACAEGMFTQMLAPRVAHLTATDISEVALSRAAERCKSLDNIRYSKLDFFHADIGGPWDLIVASEVLYYMEDGLGDLASRIASALTPEGLFVHAHAFEIVDGPDQTGFDWGDPFSAHTISRTLTESGLLERIKAIETDLYAIEIYRRCDDVVPAHVDRTRIELGSDLTTDLSAWIVWNGAVRSRGELQQCRTAEIPILMYHRVAETGPEALAQWRITPDRLEHQLRFLRRRGFHSITPADWDYEVRRHGSLRGRPILLTFDDAYVDFIEEALPVIERNGFSAHLFAVTGKVGGFSDWDSRFGPPAPLMSWDQLAECRRRGTSFGSHLHSHHAADLLSTDKLMEEAQLSRRLLEERLGIAVTTIAPPYGATDARVAEACRQAGYNRLFTVEHDVASAWANRMNTPRFEVRGDMEIEEFADMLGLLESEPPSARDLP